MRTTLPIIVLSIVPILLPGNGAVTTAQEAKLTTPQPPPARPTVKASCSLKVAWDDRIGLPELNHFLLSQPATKEAAKKHLNLDKPSQFQVRPDHGGDGTIELSLDVFVAPKHEGARHAAAEFADAVIAALPAQLQSYQESVVAREMGRANERLQRTSELMLSVRSQVSRLRDRLRERTGRADSTENWDEAISTLEQERQRASLDAAGQQARRRAIEDTIASITKRAEQRAKDDEIAQELAKIVALREEELQRAKQLVSTGRINEAEMTNIAAMIADARAKLFERREESARATGGDLLAEFNRELLMLSINAAENEARLKLIKEMLDRFHDSAADVDALRLAEQELTSRQTALQAAQEQFTAIEDRYRDIPAPTVTVLDCDHVTLEAWLQENPD